MNFNQEQLRQVLIAVLVGTAVTFLTSLLQGLIGWVGGIDDNIVGGGVGAITYAAQKSRLIS
jgi:hypothetical protein